MEGRNGGRRIGRRYRKKTAGGSSLYTISSSSSGTVVSTTYTSHSSLLSSVSMESTMHFDLEVDQKREEDEKLEHIKSLVQGFFGAPSSANCSINGYNINVLESWFTELGVGWILDVTSGASAGEREHTSTYTYDTQSWIRALAEITEAIRLMPLLFPDSGSVGLLSVREEETETQSGEKTSTLKQLQFEQFFQETMLRMLTFVDTEVSGVLASNGVPVPLENLSSLLHVHGALSKASMEIRWLYPSPPSVQVEWTGNEMVSLLLAKETKAIETIWSTVEKIRMELIEGSADSRSSLTPQGSSDIHRVTRLVTRYISFLCSHSVLMVPIVSKAASVGKYLPRFRDLLPFNSMIMEMMSCLEERLVNMSESFQDQGLKFLFLLNNSYFVREQQEINNLHLPPSYRVTTTTLSLKVDDYSKRYLEVSWAPVLSYLFNHTPLFFWIKYSSPLHKFESELNKIYTTQKLWKVPNPHLRTRLRNAITEKIIPVYTKYIEDNNITTQKFTPRNLEEMLQELFEG